MTSLKDLLNSFDETTASQGDFKIRVMTQKDLDFAIEWAAKEGWNPGLYDAEPFYKADPNGYLIGELNGEPIGCVSAVAYDDKFGFIGFYIVKPEYRGKKYGLILGFKAIKGLGDRNIGLDGVFNKQNQYNQMGFEFAYRNVRYEGVAGNNPSHQTIDLRTLPFEVVLKYDNKMFPSNRPDFLKAWINQPKSFALGITKNNVLSGYSVIRKCRVGYKIGPLFADNETIAIDLFNDITSKVSGEKIYLDVPEINNSAVKLAENNNMKIVFGTARMYTKTPPELPLDSIYGVTTFELG